MLNKNQKYKSDFIFILKEILQICQIRNYNAALIKSNLLLSALDKWDDYITLDEFESMKNNIITIIDELRFVIKAETRFILFPLPDIKKEAYEIGKKYMPNFLEWLNSEENLTPDKIIGILDEEIYRLDEAKENILKIIFYSK